MYQFSKQVGNGYVIPHIRLAPDSNYFIDVYLEGEFENENTNFQRYNLQVAKLTNKFLVDKGFQYRDVLNTFEAPPQIPFLPITGSIEVDNEFLMFNSESNKFRAYDLNYDAQQFQHLGEFSCVDEFDLVGEYKIVNLPKNRLALLGFNGVTGYLNLWILKVEPKYRSLTVLLNATFNHAEIDYGIDTLTHQEGSSYVYFISATNAHGGISVLNRVDYKTGVRSTLPTPSQGAIEFFDVLTGETVTLTLLGENVTLDSIGYSKLILLSTDSNLKSQIFDTETEEWEDLLTIPEEFKDRELKSMIGRDGKIMYFATDGLSPLGLIFNPFDYQFTISDSGPTNEPISSMVRLQTGNMLLFNSTTSFIYS